MNRTRGNTVFDVMLSLLLVGYASTPPARAQAPASATAIAKWPNPALVGSLTRRVTPEGPAQTAPWRPRLLSEGLK